MTVKMISKTLDGKTIQSMLAGLRRAPAGTFTIAGDSRKGYTVTHRSGVEVFRSMPGKNHSMVRMAENLFA
jgi:hypothetical protein